MLEPSSASHPTPSSSSSTPQTPALDVIDLRGQSVSDSPGKSTWKERNDGERGTIIKSGDIGDGLVFHHLSTLFAQQQETQNGIKLIIQILDRQTSKEDRRGGFGTNIK
jgi:hypothetical protein